MPIWECIASPKRQQKSLWCAVPSVKKIDSFSHSLDRKRTSTIVSNIQDNRAHGPMELIVEKPKFNRGFVCGCHFDDPSDVGIASICPSGMHICRTTAWLFFLQGGLESVLYARVVFQGTVEVTREPSCCNIPDFSGRADGSRNDLA